MSIYVLALYSALGMPMQSKSKRKEPELCQKRLFYELPLKKTIKLASDLTFKSANLRCSGMSSSLDAEAPLVLFFFLNINNFFISLTVPSHQIFCPNCSDNASFLQKTNPLIEILRIRRYVRIFP